MGMLGIRDATAYLHEQVIDARASIRNLAQLSIEV